MDILLKAIGSVVLGIICIAIPILCGLSFGLKCNDALKALLSFFYIIEVIIIIVNIVSR